MAHFDRDELSRCSRFLLIVGDPYHMSGITISSGTRIRATRSCTRSSGTCACST